MNKLRRHWVRLASIVLMRKYVGSFEPNPDVAIYVKDDAIGDFLFGTAMIRELQSRFKEVYIVCTPNVHSIALLYAQPAKILEIDKEKFDTEFTYRMEWLVKFQALRPSLVVTSSLRSSFADQIARVFSRPKIAIVSTDDPAAKKRRRAHLYTRLGAHPPDEQPDSKFLCGAHRKEHFLLEAAFEHPFDPSVSRPFLPTEGLPKVDRPLPANYFCVLPSTGDSRRTYPRGRFIELARSTIQRTGWSAVFLSADRISELESLAATERVIDLTTKTSIEESLGILAGARFTLTNETGLGHASWIMGRPTVMIMPGGNFHHFHSSDPALHAVYDKRECFDCHHHCRYHFDQRFPCVEQIPFAKIESAITNILSQAESRSRS